MNFSLGMSKDLLSFAKLRHFSILPEQVSSNLASIGCSVNKFIRIEVIFRSISALPPIDKLLIEQDLKTVIILIVLKDVFRHCLDIQSDLLKSERVIAVDGLISPRPSSRNNQETAKANPGNTGMQYRGPNQQDTRTGPEVTRLDN